MIFGDVTNPSGGNSNYGFPQTGKPNSSANWQPMNNSIKTNDSKLNKWTMQNSAVGGSENFRNNGLPPSNLNGFGAPGIDSVAHYWSDQAPAQQQQQRMFGAEDALVGGSYGGGNEFPQRSGSGMFGGASAGFGAQNSTLSKQQQHQWGQMGSVNQTTPWNLETAGGLNANCNPNIPPQWNKWDNESNPQQASSFQMRSIPTNNYGMPGANNFPQQQQMMFGDSMNGAMRNEIQPPFSTMNSNNGRQIWGNPQQLPHQQHLYGAQPPERGPRNGGGFSSRMPDFMSSSGPPHGPPIIGPPPPNMPPPHLAGAPPFIPQNFRQQPQKFGSNISILESSGGGGAGVPVATGAIHSYQNFMPQAHHLSQQPQQPMPMQMRPPEEDSVWRCPTDPQQDALAALRKWQRDSGTGVWGDPKENNEKNIKRWQQYFEGENDDVFRTQSPSKASNPSKEQYRGAGGAIKPKESQENGWGELPQMPELEKINNTNLINRSTTASSSTPSQNFVNQSQNFVVGRAIQNFQPHQLNNPSPQTLIVDSSGGAEFKSWSDSLAPSGSGGGGVFGTLTSNNGAATSTGSITNTSSLLGPSKGSLAEELCSLNIKNDIPALW